MATKALLYSADRLSSEQTKESRCKSLVRQLLAVEIGKRVYRYLVVRSAQEICANPPINHSAEPSNSPRTGKLRWEPPKHKRQLKAHPWVNMHKGEIFG